MTAALSIMMAPANDAGAAAPAPRPAAAPASLVNPLIGTSGDNYMFPGPDMPFGMMQWSPDTSPSRPRGGGYAYNDSSLAGFSLTHLSGPGCGAYGDIPILPTVGAIPSSPGSTAEPFSHASELARTGFYQVTLGDHITARITGAMRAGIAEFTFPATTRASLLLKLTGSDDTVDRAAARVVGGDEVTGSVTAGHFCGQSSSRERDYTLNFDIQFSRPFTAEGTWGGTTGAAVRPGSRSVIDRSARRAVPPAIPAGQLSAKVFAGLRPEVSGPRRRAPVGGGLGAERQPSPARPSGVYLTFDTAKSRTISAKVGISFTSRVNARANLDAEIPCWNFGAVERASQGAWNAILRRVQIYGGSAGQQAEFYTALYHALLHPNVFSDVNGQYMGFDGKVHRAAPGHAEYANYSGWDIYRSQVQLAAMVAGQQMSDAVTSMLDDYSQTGLLPKWNLGGGESYVMAGDPADAIIADAYAFGARDFNVRKALQDMVAEATTTNNIRPGNAALLADGYLPYDGTYGCCDFDGAVSTQLEYDTADYAIASLARATGDTADYRKFATLAQSWAAIFNVATGYMQAKLASGQWLSGFTPATRTGFEEGTSAQYTPMVPFDIRALINARGGDAAWISYLNSLTSNLTSPGPTNASLANEPSLGIPYEYDYAGAPSLTQRVVRSLEQELYFNAPAGEPGNDDLGALSSAYVWDELGFYPETPGTPILALGSPVFPKAVISMNDHGALVINAPGAQPAAPYVHRLTVNGTAWDKAYVEYPRLPGDTTLDFTLSATPDTSWASSPGAAPPSDPTGEHRL